jgi:hypothetical protein
MMRRLVEQGKVLAMVSDYDGHSGSWVSEKTTYDLYQAIRSNDRVALVQPGGRLNLRFIDPNSDPRNPRVIGVKKLDLYHAPPGGSGDINPTAGLSKAARRQKSRGPDLGASGHKHVGAFSIELDPRGNEIISVQVGSDKGSNPDLPRDRMFLGKAPGRRPHRAGGGITMRQTKDNGIKLMPSYGLNTTELFNNAFSALDSAEAQNLTEELIGDIQSRLGETKPVIKFDRGSSVKDDDPSLLETRANGKKDRENEQAAEIASPEKPEDQYSRLAYRVETSLPFLLFFGSHFDFGSNASKMKRFREMREEFLKAVQDNPHAALMLMNNLMHRTVPGNPSRRYIVEDEVARSLSSLGEEGRILGLMLSGEDFRSEKWKHSVGGDGPFMPGTYLAQRLNTRLYNNMSEIQLKVGPKNGRSLPTYNVLAVDKVGQYGSRQNTFNGLRSTEANFSGEVDVVAGGHMPGAGVLLAQDPYSATPEKTYVAPGYFSKWSGQGKGNQQDASPGGQGVIMMADEKLVIPVADLDSALEQHLAFYLYLGLIKTGLIDNVLG